MRPTLLQTKLFVPTARPNLVARHHLIDKLNASTSNKLTLISAPAGFGKTTLVTAWIQQTKPLTAWLSLDENDNEIVRFLTYFVAALQTIDSRLGTTAVSILQSPQPPQIEPFFTSLINDLVQQSNHLTLVLDDYHLIQEKNIHKGLAFLLDHMPPQLHLIITTRANPPLPLAKLRARGQMQEIRVNALRFSIEEVAKLFKGQLSHQLSQADLHTLAERTEGWITGLQLAAISLQEQAEPKTFIQSFTGSNQFILDYLLEEVLQQQPPHVQSFLMETAVLTQLSGPLCDAVTGQTNSQQILEHLHTINLFVIALDDKREWFRYHHLFADLLEHRLQQSRPKQVNELHNHASRWYETNGYITEALYHARAIANYDRAFQLIKEHATQKSYEGQSNMVFAWVDNMPIDYIRNKPYLTIIKAWQALYFMQLAESEKYLAQAEQVLDKTDQSTAVQEMFGEIYSLRAWAVHYQGHDQQTITLSRQALDYLPLDNLHARGLILGPLAGALMNAGETEAALATYQQAIDAYQKMGNLLALVGIALEMSNVYLVCGQLRQAETFLQTVFEQCQSEITELGQIYCGIANIHYEKYALETAVIYLQKALSITQHKLTRQYAYHLLAKIYTITNAPQQAQVALQEAEASIQQWDTTSIQTKLLDLKIQIALRAGDITLAARLHNERKQSPSTHTTYQDEEQQLTLARLLIAQGRSEANDDKLHDALALLNSLQKTAVVARRFARIMEAQILCALIYNALKQTKPAITAITKALQLAQTEGYRRLFIDEGAPMANLLQQLPQTPFILNLLNDLPQADIVHPNQNVLIEPLSDRELEVLRLMAQDYAYREIANELIVSLNTVRYHVKNIYTKLNVNKKTQAIAKAKNLNLI